MDCELSTWGEWDACSATCGGGMQAKTRTVQTPANGGKDCEGELEKEQECGTDACPLAAAAK